MKMIRLTESHLGQIPVNTVLEVTQTYQTRYKAKWVKPSNKQTYDVWISKDKCVLINSRQQRKIL